MERFGLPDKLYSESDIQWGFVRLFESSRQSDRVYPG